MYQYVYHGDLLSYFLVAFVGLLLAVTSTDAGKGIHK